MSLLFDNIRRVNPAQAATLIKHLNSAGIYEISDFTFAGILELSENVKNKLAPGSARTFFASLKSIINKCYAPSIRPDLSDLQARPDRTNKTFLTPEDLARPEAAALKAHLLRLLWNEQGKEAAEHA